MTDNINMIYDFRRSKLRRAMIFLIVFVVGSFCMVKIINSKSSSIQKLSKSSSSISTSHFDKLNILLEKNGKNFKTNEGVEIILYDLSQPPSNNALNLDCPLLQNSKPPYYICPIEGQDPKKIEDQEFQEMIKKFYEQYPNAVFVDLGSKIGSYSLFVASLNSRINILAVDPYPANLIRFHRAARLNNIHDRITVVVATLAGERGVVSFKKPTDPDDDSSLNSIFLDDLISSLKSLSAFIKIDLEVSECHVFKNSNKFFSVIDVPYILMKTEHKLKENMECVENMLTFLKTNKYKPFSWPYKYGDDKNPLDFTKWTEWKQHDVIFKKF